MAVSFQILPARGLVIVTYRGDANVEETMRVFAEYVAHPDFQPGHKQLIDLTLITGYEKDFVRLMETQAIKAESLVGKGTQSLMVYLTPTRISQSMSAMIVKSWEDVDAVVPLVQHNEADALAILGQPENSIAELLALVEG